MARVLGYGGLGNTNGERSFAGKQEASDAVEVTLSANSWQWVSVTYPKSRRRRFASIEADSRAYVSEVAIEEPRFYSTEPFVLKKPRRTRARITPRSRAYSIPRDRSVEIQPFVIEISLPDFAIRRPVPTGTTLAGADMVRPIGGQARVRAIG